MNYPSAARLVAPIAIAATLFSGAARACCDGFWSCVGAVASAGLSCVIEEAQRAAVAILNLARTALSNANQTYTATIADLNARLNEARTNATNASNQAIASLNGSYQHIQTAINRPPVNLGLAGTGATDKVREASPKAWGNQATPVAPGPAPDSALSNKNLAPAVNLKPASQTVVVASAPGAISGAVAVQFADAAAVDRSVRLALTFTDTLRTQASNTHLPSALRISSTAQNALQKGIQDVEVIFRRHISSPLESIIGQLANFDPTGIVRLVAVLATSLDGVFAAVDRELTPPLAGLDTMLGEQMAQLEAAVNPILVAADLARQIDKAVLTVLSIPSPSNLKKLDALLPAQPKTPPDITALRGLHAVANIGLAPVFKAGPFKPANKSAMAIKTLLTPLSAQLKDPRIQAKFQVPKNPTEYVNKTQQYLNAELAGLSGAQLAAKREQLLAQAHERFSKDPKTEQAARNFILQFNSKNSNQEVKL
jgi:hypothetical protein